MVNRALRRKLLIVGFILVVIGVASLFFSHKNHTDSATSTNQAPQSVHPSTLPNGLQSNPDTKKLELAIQGDDNPGSTYQVTSISQPVSGWFIVKVIMTNQYGTFNQLAVVEQKLDADSNNTSDDDSLDVVAGPDTSFPTTYLQSQGIPSKIISQLPVYNDAQ